MKPKKQNTPQARDTRKKWGLALVGLLVFFGCAWYVATGWKTPQGMDPSSGTGHEKKAEQGPGAQKPAGPEVSGEGETTGSVNAEEGEKDQPIDPRLANVTITEWPVSQPGDEPGDPERAFHVNTIATLAKPLKDTVKGLSSFVYKGRMDVIVPTLAKTEEEYKATGRYGKGMRVVSSFTLVRDGQGNWSLGQATKTEAGDTKYDTPEYNGTLYFVDNAYTYVDAAGKPVDPETLQKVLALHEEGKGEPLVRKNWMRIIKDLDLVVDFDPAASPGPGQSLDIKPANQEIQEKTQVLENLVGNVTILDDPPIMSSATLEGKAKLRSGFMSGADVAYSILLNITDIGEAPPVSAP